MSDRIAWFISGACLSALLLTTTGFKTVPDGPGALGAGETMITQMDILEPQEERVVYTVPEGFILSLTDWRINGPAGMFATYPDSTQKQLNRYWAGNETGKVILRTGVALPPGAELLFENYSNNNKDFSFTGQLLRE